MTGYSWSIAHLTALAVDPPTLLDLAARTGCEYVGLRLTRLTPEEPHHPLVSDHDLLRRTQAVARATGVRVHDVEVARLDPATEPESLLGLLHVAAELGASYVVTQTPDPDVERAADKLGRLATSRHRSVSAATWNS